MSIVKVEVMNSQGNLLTLTLDDISNGYVVKGVDGLDPVKATMVSSNFATMAGQQYQASNRDIRNIIISLGYAPNFSANETVRALRSRLYQFFMPDSPVTLTFYMQDELVVTIDGRVESCGAPLFVADPQTDVSIVCFNPDFIDVELIQMHSTFLTTDTAPQPIEVVGTIPTGLTLFQFTAAKTLTGFTIYHTTPGGVLRTMEISAPLILGDVVTMCTIEGQKSITRTRTGVATSLLWAVSPQSAWVELQPGTNQFYMNASSTNPSTIFVDYYNRYGGL